MVNQKVLLLGALAVGVYALSRRSTIGAALPTATTPASPTVSEPIYSSLPVLSSSSSAKEINPETGWPYALDAYAPTVQWNLQRTIAIVRPVQIMGSDVQGYEDFGSFYRLYLNTNKTLFHDVGVI